MNPRGTQAFETPIPLSWDYRFDPQASERMHLQAAGQPFLQAPPQGLPQGESQDLRQLDLVRREDALVAAEILFPRTWPRPNVQSVASTHDPRLDAELDSLKTLVLAQPSFSPPSSSQPILHPRMVQLMQELLPGAISVVNDSLGSPHVVFNLSQAQGELRMVGMYTLAERQVKIRRYKEKIRKWRLLHPVNRTFEGRREIAFTKPRFNGRFAAKNRAHNADSS